MKKLREGVSTGSCMTGGAAASAIWQTTGRCPDMVEVETPIGKTLYLEVIPRENRACGIIKDAGDDPDVTHGSEVITQVEILDENGPISFIGGKGIGRVTQEGLKIPPGDWAINPVPRQMTEKALRRIIGDKAAVVTVSIPGGEELARKTFNPRLGILGGLSVLGTTGIVRPMSEEAMKDSLLAELDMYANQGFREILFVLGTTGENALKAMYGDFKCILQVSNYIGFMIEEAVERGFTGILIGGFAGKLVKVASGTMNTHSHVSDGRIETICTHLALKGAPTELIRRVYDCFTTKSAMELVKKEGYERIWTDIAQKASVYCIKTAHEMAEVGIILLDADQKLLAASENADRVLARVLVHVHRAESTDERKNPQDPAEDPEKGENP